jgi:hypothetical protein
MLRYRVAAVLTALGLASGGHQARAQQAPAAEDAPVGVDAPESGSPPAWRATVSTYAWLAGFSGQVRPMRQAPAVSIDKSFSEVWDNLDASLFVNAMARRGRWVLLGDLNHTSSSDSGTIPVMPGLTARGGFSQTTLLALSGYRLHEDAQQSFDVYGGARWWRVRSHVSARLGGTPVLSMADRFQWIDPVLAARYRRAFTTKDEMLLYADLGGFGVGAKRSWQWLALYNRALGRRWMFSAGYRMVSTDYRAGGHVHDVRIGGPLLGLTWRF